MTLIRNGRGHRSTGGGGELITALGSGREPSVCAVSGSAGLRRRRHLHNVYSARCGCICAYTVVLVPLSCQVRASDLHGQTDVSCCTYIVHRWAFASSVRRLSRTVANPRSRGMPERREVPRGCGGSASQCKLRALNSIMIHRTAAKARIRSKHA